MKKVLIDYMKEFADFDEDKYHEIADDIPIKSFKKNTILIEQGDKISKCYFVLSGLVRQYTINEEGKETTFGLFTEKQAVAVAGSDDSMESKYSLECLEDCILIEGVLDNEAAMFDKHSELESMVLKMVESDMSKVKDAFSDFMSSTPEERYKKLKSTRPELFDRVPKNLLASYLGITPESFSRIKKRLEQDYLKLVD